MTVALVPPLSTSNPNVSDPSDARKRRRAILALQRTVSDTTTDPSKKRRKQVASDDDSSEEESSRRASSKKKPQLKYDPDVPMTKEEAAVWRREQRRQRNRLSAANSRQRQRDHIHELQGELNEWKNKYQEVMAKIQAIERASPGLAVPPRAFSPETIHSVPHASSPTSTAVFLDVGNPEENLKLPGDFLDHNPAQPSKMISRPAMSRIMTSITSTCSYPVLCRLLGSLHPTAV